MPAKTKTYRQVIFDPQVIVQACRELSNELPRDKRNETSRRLHIKVGDEEWSHDTEEEFFSDYRKDFHTASFNKTFAFGTGAVELLVLGKQWVYGSVGSKVTVTAPSRASVERVFSVFETQQEGCRVPAPPSKEKPRPRLKVFIGHGGSPQWRDLKDHLQDKHGIEVEAYEIGARAGLTVKEILHGMLTRSSLAFLVMTGEDEDAEGHLHARENVIHELGLFQGALGWHKAVVLLEEGVGEFSNIHGTNQIRYGKGNIRETFGEVLATIRREFSLEAD